MDHCFHFRGAISASRGASDVLSLVVQLQKVLNDPRLVKPRSITSSFSMDPVHYTINRMFLDAAVSDLWKVAVFII